MLVRAERPSDFSRVSDVVGQAFQKVDAPDDPVVEVRLVEALRGTPEWIPQQSLVAVVDDEIVGYCVSSRAHVEETPVLGLGPIGVVPEWQGRGAGTALMHEAIDVATLMGEPLICLLGDDRYYSRFGFVAASEMGIHAPEPEWGKYFQAKTLPAYDPTIGGRFEYARPFRDLS